MNSNPRIPRRADISSQPDYTSQFLPRLGKTISKYRKQAAFTQKELSDHLQVTVTHISALENGRRGVSLHVLYRIAGILAINIAQLINESDGQSPN